MTNLSIKRLDITHEAETAGLMCKTFLTEPLTVAAEVPEEKFLSFCREVFRQAVRENLAFGVIDESSGQIVAFWMCEEDKSFQKALVTPAPLQEMVPIFELLGRVHDLLPKAAKEILDIQDLTQEKILHMFMVGVRSDHTGKGISEWFTAEVLKLATSEGFTLATVEATNPGSQRPLMNLGFLLSGQVEYDKTPFDQIPRIFARQKHSCTGCSLLIKPLNL